MVRKILAFFTFPDLSTVDQLLAISLVLYAVTIPFALKVNNFMLIVAGVLFVFSTKRSEFSQLHKLLFLMMMSYIGIHVVSLFATDDLAEGLFQLEKRIPLIVFPVLFFFKPQDSGLMQKILRAFVVAVLLACACSIILSLFYWTTDFFAGRTPDLFAYFSYEQLSRRIGLHPTYFSMYILFSIIVLMQEKRLNLIFIYFFVIMLVLLSSRIALIGFFILLIVAGRNVLKKRNSITVALIGITFVCSFLVLLFVSPTARNRQVVDYMSFDSANGYTGINMRVIHWTASVKALHGHYLLGAGVGDSQHALDEAYHDMGVDNFIGFNSHSQFLWDTLTFGIGGLIVLLINFFLPMVLAFKRHDYVYFSLLFIVFLFSITECVLFVNKGIVFFAFFNSLFLFTSPAMDPKHHLQVGMKAMS